jgi:hypothetical protein
MPTFYDYYCPSCLALARHQRHKQLQLQAKLGFQANQKRYGGITAADIGPSPITSRPCRWTWDCPKGYGCNSGKCAPHTTCGIFSNCPPYATCVGGKCVRK